MARRKGAYGHISLTQENLDLIVQSIRSNLSRLRGACAAANSEEERKFYAGRIEWNEAAEKRYGAIAPGVLSFTEKELDGLRGVIATVKQAVFEELTLANRANDIESRKRLLDVITPLVELLDLLSVPYLNDRSQDAATEDDADEGDVA